MNKRNVEKHLSKKFGDWVNSLPGELAQQAADNCIITGGSIVSLLTGVPVNDYDIYFRTKEYALAIAEHYVNVFNNTSSIEHATGLGDVSIYAVRDENDRVRIVVKSAGVAKEGKQEGYTYFEGEGDDVTSTYVDNVMSAVEEAGETKEEAIETHDEMPDEEPYQPIFLSSNAITLSGHIQLIVRFCGSPREIHENFDYIHCTNYWLPKDGKLHLNRKALTSILTKQLEYTGSKYPVCSLFRLRKFLARGWKITAGQILKIALQISDLDLENYETLEDQLIGVDVAYFEQLIDRMKSHDPEKVDRGYLIEIIDEMF